MRKTTQEQIHEMSLPIRTKRSKKYPVAVSFNVLVCRWCDQEYMDIEDRFIIKGEMWMKVGDVWLNPMLVDERNLVRGLAKILSRFHPCSEEEAEEIVKTIKRQNMKHALLCLESDLIPTSPDRYQGKNKWRVMTGFPDRDVMVRKLNKVLKAQGSNLRVRGRPTYIK